MRSNGHSRLVKEGNITSCLWLLSYGAHMGDLVVCRAVI